MENICSLLYSIIEAFRDLFHNKDASFQIDNTSINSLPNEKNLDWSKSKAFADDNFKMVESSPNG